MGQSQPSKTRGLQLLLAIDSKFEALASVAVCSFLLHHPFERVIVVTPMGTTLEKLPRIANAFNVPFLQIPIPSDCPTQRLETGVRPYFYCISAIDIICNLEEPGRFLYVDADTLCIRSLEELALLPLSDTHLIAACSHGRPMPDRSLVLELKTPYHYFNAGIMLFDSDSLVQAMNAASAVSYYEANNALCRFREQCVLNALLKDKIRYLPNQYNYLSWMRERMKQHEWHSLCINPMAYCLPDVRSQLAIVHLSAGGLPFRLPPERLESVDHYWLEISNHLESKGSLSTPNRFDEFINK